MSYSPMPRFFAILLSSLLAIADVSAQTHTMRSLGGPDGGSIARIAIAPNGEIFVLSGQLLYHQDIFDKSFGPLASVDVAAQIAIDSNGNVYYSGLNGNGIYEGDEFTKIEALNAFDQGSNISILGRNTLANFRGKALALLVDGSWLRDTLTSNIREIHASNDTLIALTDAGIYYRLKGNISWTKVQTGIASSIQSVEVTPIGVVVGTGAHGVWIADRIGGEFLTISDDLPDWQIQDVMYADGRIVSAHQNNVYTTSDLGQTWIEGQGRIRTTPVEVLAARNGIWYAGTEGSALFISSDRGENWHGLNAGIAGADVKSIHEHKGQIWTGSLFGAVHTYLPSTDTWTDQNKGLRSNATITRFLSREHTLYALEARAGLYKWVTDSSAWIKVPLTLSISSSYPDMALLDDRTLVVISESVYLLDLMTGAFTRKQFGEFQLRDVEIASGKIYLASDSGAFVSDDRGSSWQKIYDGRSWRIIASEGTLTISAARTGGAMFRSTDDGMTWTELLVAVNELSESNGVLYGFDATGIIRSTDLGSTWNLIVDESISTMSEILTTTDNRILVGANTRGLLELAPLNSVRASQASGGIAIAVSPNPTTSHAEIFFSLPGSGHYDLKIYNAIGQLVGSLVFGVGSGEQRHYWDASELPAGVYTVSLRASDSVSTQKFIVQR